MGTRVKLSIYIFIVITILPGPRVLHLVCHARRVCHAHRSADVNARSWQRVAGIWCAGPVGGDVDRYASHPGSKLLSRHDRIECVAQPQAGKVKSST